jgi:hypothetical protein
MSEVKKIAAAKYADKSEGQLELLPIFDTLKKLVSGYVKGNFKVIADKPGQYEVYYVKEVEVLGRPYPGLSFASVLIQKGYVGFYFFPANELKDKLQPELLKTLQGKTCFHIKKNGPVILKQVKDALQIGYDFYQSKGWV